MMLMSTPQMGAAAGLKSVPSFGKAGPSLLKPSTSGAPPESQLPTPFTKEQVLRALIATCDSSKSLVMYTDCAPLASRNSAAVALLPQLSLGEHILSGPTDGTAAAVDVFNNGTPFAVADTEAASAAACQRPVSVTYSARYRSSSAASMGALKPRSRATSAAAQASGLSSPTFTLSETYTYDRINTGDNHADADHPVEVGSSHMLPAVCEEIEMRLSPAGGCVHHAAAAPRTATNADGHQNVLPSQAAALQGVHAVSSAWQPDSRFTRYGSAPHGTAAPVATSGSVAAIPSHVTQAHHHARAMSVDYASGGALGKDTPAHNGANVDLAQLLRHSGRVWRERSHLNPPVSVAPGDGVPLVADGVIIVAASRPRAAAPCDLHVLVPASPKALNTTTHTSAQWSTEIAVPSSPLASLPSPSPTAAAAVGASPEAAGLASPASPTSLYRQFKSIRETMMERLQMPNLARNTSLDRRIRDAELSSTSSLHHHHHLHHDAVLHQEPSSTTTTSTSTSTAASCSSLTATSPALDEYFMQPVATDMKDGLQSEQPHDASEDEVDDMHMHQRASPKSRMLRASVHGERRTSAGGHKLPVGACILRPQSKAEVITAAAARGACCTLADFFERRSASAGGALPAGGSSCSTAVAAAGSSMAAAAVDILEAPYITLATPFAAASHYVASEVQYVPGYSDTAVPAGTHPAACQSQPCAAQQQHEVLPDVHEDGHVPPATTSNLAASPCDSCPPHRYPTTSTASSSAAQQAQAAQAKRRSPGPSRLSRTSDATDGTTTSGDVVSTTDRTSRDHSSAHSDQYHAAISAARAAAGDVLPLPPLALPLHLHRSDSGSTAAAAGEGAMQPQSAPGGRLEPTALTAVRFAPLTGGRDDPSSSTSSTPGGSSRAARLAQFRKAPQSTSFKVTLSGTVHQLLDKGIPFAATSAETYSAMCVAAEVGDCAMLCMHLRYNVHYYAGHGKHAKRAGGSWQDGLPLPSVPHVAGFEREVAVEAITALLQSGCDLHIMCPGEYERLYVAAVSDSPLIYDILAENSLLGLLGRHVAAGGGGAAQTAAGDVRSAPTTTGGDTAQHRPEGAPAAAAVRTEAISAPGSTTCAVTSVAPAPATPSQASTTFRPITTAFTADGAPEGSVPTTPHPPSSTRHRRHSSLGSDASARDLMAAAAAAAAAAPAGASPLTSNTTSAANTPTSLGSCSKPTSGRIFKLSMPGRSASLPRPADAGLQVLLRAVHFGNVGAVQRLLAGGEDPNKQDPDTGRTPLHVAADAGCWQVAHLLVSWGAFLKVRDMQGRTPLDLARRKRHGAVAQLLKHAAASREQRRTLAQQLARSDVSTKLEAPAGPSTTAGRLAAMFAATKSASTPRSLHDNDNDHDPARHIDPAAGAAQQHAVKAGGFFAKVMAGFKSAGR